MKIGLGRSYFSLNAKLGLITERMEEGGGRKTIEPSSVKRSMARNSLGEWSGDTAAFFEFFFFLPLRIDSAKDPMTVR